MPNLFFVTSRYTAPAETISPHLAEHREWVDELYRHGTFVLSGRLAPATGGFMLARDISLEELDSLLATDPFRLHDLLEHTVIELAPTRSSAELEGLMEPPR